MRSDILGIMIKDICNAICSVGLCLSIIMAIFSAMTTLIYIFSPESRTILELKVVALCGSFIWIVVLVGLGCWWYGSAEKRAIDKRSE